MKLSKVRAVMEELYNAETGTEMGEKLSVDKCIKQLSEIVLAEKKEYPRDKYDWVDVGGDIGWNEATDHIAKLIMGEVR